MALITEMLYDAGELGIALSDRRDEQKKLLLILLKVLLSAWLKP